MRPVRAGLPTLLLLFAFMAKGQYVSAPSPTSYTYILDRLSSINATTTPIPGVPLPKPTLRGSSFLQENFGLTTFLLEGDVKPESGFAKYDAVFDEFLIMRGKEFRRLSGKIVLSFSWTDSISYAEHHYVRGKFFNAGKAFDPTNFVEVIVIGKLPLLKVTEMIVKDPNYNIALDVGRRDYQIFRKEAYYVGDGQSIIELPPVRQIPFLFGQHAPYIQQLIELNELDLKNEAHLAAVFDFYNERQ